MKAAIALSLAIVFAAVGDILFSRGMQAGGEVKVHSFWDIPPLMAQVFTTPLILAGMLSMAINLAAYITALAWIDVSVANPMTALSYVIASAYGALVVRERVSPKRWIGVTLITLGAILVGLSS